MEFKVFIDGEAGTTGLKVAERLQAHPHVQILRVDEAERKNAAARADMMAASDVPFCAFPTRPLLRRSRWLKHHKHG
jgi:N-acetyl-gamma-glutamyl-phosphate reductase